MDMLSSCALSSSSVDSLPVPTHYYTVVSSCQELNQTVEECDGPLNVFSFLIPHRENNHESCNVSAQPPGSSIATSVGVVVPV